MSYKELYSVFEQLNLLSEHVNSHFDGFKSYFEISFYMDEECPKNISQSNKAVYNPLNGNHYILEENFILDLYSGKFYFKNFKYIFDIFDFINTFKGSFSSNFYKDESESETFHYFYEGLDLIKPNIRIGEICFKSNICFIHRPITVNHIKKLLKFKGSEYEQEIENWFQLFISNDKANQEIAKQILKSIK